MSKRLTVILPQLTEEDLTRSSCQIPWFLQQHHGYESKLVAPAGQFLEQRPADASLIEVQLINPEGAPKKAQPTFEYVQGHARVTDVLWLYGMHFENMITGIHYKRRNPKGTLIVQVRSNEHRLKHKNFHYSPKWLRNRKWMKKERRFLKGVDLFLTNSHAGADRIQELFGNQAHATIQQPQGVNNQFLCDHFPLHRTFKEKQDLLMVYGPIGKELYGHNLLLETIPMLDFMGWKMVFIGDPSNEFVQLRESFFRDYPSLRERVIFTGKLRNRLELFDWLDRSKVFCFPSEHEEFSKELVEAAYFGNHLVGWKGNECYREVSGHFQLGTALAGMSSRALANRLQEIIDGDIDITKHTQEISHFTREHYNWKHLASQVHESIQASGKT